MLFYDHPKSPAPLPRAKRWGLRRAHRILENPRGCTYAAHLSKIAEHCPQKLPTRGDRVPKGIPKAHFWELRGALFIEKL